MYYVRIRNLLFQIVEHHTVALAEKFVSSALGTLLLIGASGVVYFVAVFWLKVFDKNELKILPSKQN